MIESSEILLFLRLLAAHLIADFLLQPNSWIKKRKQYQIRTREFYYHIGIVGLLTYLFMGDLDHVGLPVFIIATHFLIDWWKSSQEESASNFIIDQGAHLVMLAIGWDVYVGGGEIVLTSIFGVIRSPSFWTVFIGYLIVSSPLGYLIAQITNRWQKDLSAGDSTQLSGLQKAGMWIGYTERFIILTFILLNQYSAIGFLIAAKSIFRFSGKIEGNQERKEAEYILIGTLLSFSLCIVVGITAKYLLNSW